MQTIETTTKYGRYTKGVLSLQCTVAVLAYGIDVAFYLMLIIQLLNMRIQGITVGLVQRRKLEISWVDQHLL
jgi:hypothetical protein